ncbi:MAG: SufS family cysteine desulfurase [Proteobacteria bacterium]|nr:SufS family cysteine desulfurase [Pseudomonadota bacterium]
MTTFSAEKIRQDFPLIKHHHKTLAFLDSAASSQKPHQVIERMDRYYRYEHANIHRGLYALSEKATQAYEQSRTTVADFLTAPDPKEVIFTRGCTEAINLVAHGLSHSKLSARSEVILSVAEHHANIVPWQMLAKKIGFKLHFLPLTENGVVDIEVLKELLSERTTLVSIAHVSNVLGTIQPVQAISQLCKDAGCYFMLDGAQATPHLEVDVTSLGVDFYVFSSHKMCGPTGVGVLWGKRQHLEEMPPYHGGGDMIEKVTVDGFSITDIPHKFEAGTPHIAGVIGLEAAIIYLKSLDRLGALNHDIELGIYLREALRSFPYIRTYCPNTTASALTCTSFLEASWVGIVSFSHLKIHAHDLACFADTYGVALRAGHHCAMPLHSYLKTSSTLRASPYLYNNCADVDRLIEALHAAEKVFLA